MVSNPIQNPIIKSAAAATQPRRTKLHAFRAATRSSVCEKNPSGKGAGNEPRKRA